MKKSDKISTFIFYLSIFLFIFAFNFQHNPPGGWYQQFLPDIGGREIVDITFTDSLNGYIITSRLSSTDSSLILQTTNSGDNWIFIHSDSGFIYKHVQFLNQSTGYVGGTKLIKTTNSGMNWDIVNTPFQSFMDDFYVLNEDTIWFAMSESLTGGLFRTTNGGVNWTQQYSAGSNNPRKIYMYDSNTGYMSANVSNGLLLKTTNSGVNWVTISGEAGFIDIEFIDANTGWKANGMMKKTTDGGSNWVTQPMPFGGYIFSNSIIDFTIVDETTLWGTGGVVFYGMGQFRGILYKTTNGGNTWYYQIPDTSIHIFGYSKIQFIDATKGWAYSPGSGGIHTKVGGDTTFLSINPISNEIPANFQLEQNYPNPFNPATNIRFKIKSSDFVKLSVYDITGKEISVLVKGKLSAGEYEFAFDGSKLTSGVYFYRLQIEDYSDTKKMLLVK